MVVENDRRDQHEVVYAGRSGQHGEAAVVPAAPRRGRGARRRLQQRDEATAGDGGDDVRADHRRGDRLVLVRRGRSGVGDGQAHAGHPVVVCDLDGDRAEQAPGGSVPAGRPRVPRRRPRRVPRRAWSTSVAVQTDSAVRARSRVRRPRPTSARRPAGVMSSSTGTGRRCASVCSACRCCNCRNRTTSVSVPPPSTSSRVSSVPSSPSPASAAPGGPSTPNCQRHWFFRDDAR